MKTLILLLACFTGLPALSQAITIPTVAGIFSIAASSGQIIKEGHDLARHPIKTAKHHGQQIKDAVKGKH